MNRKRKIGRDLPVLTSEFLNTRLKELTEKARINSSNVYRELNDLKYQLYKLTQERANIAEIQEIKKRIAEFENHIFV